MFTEPSCPRVLDWLSEARGLVLGLSLSLPSLSVSLVFLIATVGIIKILAQIAVSF